MPLDKQQKTPTHAAKNCTMLRLALRIPGWWEQQNKQEVGKQLG